MATLYPQLLALYDGYDHHIKRVDAARYLYLLTFGGIYMDLDSVVLRPLDDLLRKKETQTLPTGESGPSRAPCVFGFAHRSNTLSTHAAVANAFMASPPEHPFMRMVVGALNRTRKRDVMHATGPNFLNSQLKVYTSNATLHDAAPVVLHPMP